MKDVEYVKKKDRIGDGTGTIIENSGRRYTCKANPQKLPLQTQVISVTA